MESVPIIFFLLCCCIIVVPFSALIIFLIMKTKKQSWSGTITDKQSYETEDFDTNVKSINYYVTVKTDEDKELKLAVDKGRYNDYKVGDRLRKRSGDLWPEKI